jgi:hypothetical protein
VFVPLLYKNQHTKLGSLQHIWRSKEMCISVIQNPILMFRTNFFMHKIIRGLIFQSVYLHLVSLQFSIINCYKT